MSPEITLLLYVMAYDGRLFRYALTIHDRNKIGCEWEYWMEPDVQTRLKRIAGIEYRDRIVRVEDLDGTIEADLGERGEG